MKRKIVAFTLVLAVLTGALSANMAQSPTVLAQDTPSSVEDYDFNNNGIIDLEEAIAALNDYLVYGVIDAELARAVIDSYLSGEVIVVSPANPLAETCALSPITFRFTYGGRMVQSSIPIFNEQNDYDGDGIDDCWELAAANELNPHLEFDEEEGMYALPDVWPHDEVVSFVRVTPYPSRNDTQYIVFHQRFVFTRDYGRYGEGDIGEDSHHGDNQGAAMAWKVLNDNTMRLEWVFTDAHTGETEHDGVWRAFAEGATVGAPPFSCNRGNICESWESHALYRALFGEQSCDNIATEIFCSSLEFFDNRLKLQVSEGKHAIYPSCQVCEEVVLARPIVTSQTIDGIMALLSAGGTAIAGLADLLLGWINFADETIGPSQQVALTYDDFPARIGLVPVNELHFEGDGAHYVLNWHMRTLNTRMEGSQYFRDVEIVIDSLYCNEETTVDQGSWGDEPYLVVTGFTIYPDVRTWVAGNSRIICREEDGDSIDDNEACHYCVPVTVFQGTISQESIIGFNVFLREQDTSSSYDRASMANIMQEKLFDEMSSVVLSHVGDCLVGAGSYASSWSVGIGEDCGGPAEWVKQVPAYNVGEPPDNLLPQFDQEGLMISDFGFYDFGQDEHLEGVLYHGTLHFCGGLGCSNRSPAPILSSLEDIPPMLADRLDEDMGR
jgi:hypothetical protein